MTQMAMYQQTVYGMLGGVGFPGLNRQIIFFTVSKPAL